MRDNGFTLRCFSQADMSRKDEHQLPRKGYFKIPRSHYRKDLLLGGIFSQYEHNGSFIAAAG